MVGIRRLIPGISSIVIIVVGAYMSTRLSAQTPPVQEPFDFSNAVYAEVRDDRGQAILRGQFTTSNTDATDIERKATLKPTDIDTDASGEAEIEVSGSGDTRRQEVEFEVRNLQPGAAYIFVIDGRDVATVTTDNRGWAEYERDAPLPAGSARR
jgi:hypothetical protein